MLGKKKNQAQSIVYPKNMGSFVGVYLTGEGESMATTKRQLSRRIAMRLGIKQESVRDVLQSFLDEMVVELAAGNRLEFRDFGIFDVAVKRSRRARNPRTGETVIIPPKRVVHFKPGRIMKNEVAKGITEEEKARYTIPLT